MFARDVIQRTLSTFLWVLNVLLYAYVIMSWIRPRSYNRSNRWFFTLDEYVRRLVDPFLNPIRSLLPTSSMGIDFSVLILWGLILLAQSAVRRWL